MDSIAGATLQLACVRAAGLSGLPVSEAEHATWRCSEVLLELRIVLRTGQITGSAPVPSRKLKA